MREWAQFSLLPANDTDVASVFRLLDEIDHRLDAELPHATALLRFVATCPIGD